MRTWASHIEANSTGLGSYQLGGVMSPAVGMPATGWFIGGCPLAYSGGNQLCQMQRTLVPVRRQSSTIVAARLPALLQKPADFVVLLIKYDVPPSWSVFFLMSRDPVRT